MQLEDNTFLTDSITCKRFIQLEKVSENFGILSEKFRPNLGKVRFKYLVTVLVPSFWRA